MKRRTWQRAGAGVLIAAVATAGCGSSSDRLSASEFRQQANAVCEHMNKRFDAAFKDFPTDREPTPEEMQSFFRDSVPIVEAAVKQLDALRPPKELADRFDDYLVAQRSGTANARKAASSPDAAVAASKGEDPASARANKIASELDLQTCVGK